MPTTFNLSMTLNDLYYLFNEVKEKVSQVFYEESSQLDSNYSSHNT